MTLTDHRSLFLQSLLKEILSHPLVLTLLLSSEGPIKVKCRVGALASTFLIIQAQNITLTLTENKFLLRMEYIGTTKETTARISRLRDTC